MTTENRVYKGHEIRISDGEQEQEPELLIDGTQVSYGQMPDGRYFLDDYAFDWSADLMDLACKWIDYKERVGQT